MIKKEIKYLHISPDDKFFDYIIENCEAVAPEKHLYIVRNITGGITYVKNDRVIAAKNYLDILNIYNSYKDDIEHIIIHFLSGDSIEFILKVASMKLKITWVLWGADGYALPKLANYKYLKHTHKLVSKINEENYFISKLKEIAKLYLGAKGRSSQLVQAVKRINRCATWVKGDFDLISTYNKDLEYVYFNNNSVEQLVVNIIELNSYTKISKGYVVLGNSGTPTNNHIEALQLLKDNSSLDVVLPLSYGNQKYINEILREGENLLGKRFIPLLNFMPKEDYNSLLHNADLIIMNHIRQQAANNIITALWLGRPVLMNVKSPLYKTFKSWGIKIENISSLSDKKELVTSTEQRETNRKILLDNLGENEIRKGFKNLLD